MAQGPVGNIAVSPHLRTPAAVSQSLQHPRMPSSHRGRGLCLQVELSPSPRPSEVEICAIWGRTNPEFIYIFPCTNDKVDKTSGPEFKHRPDHTVFRCLRSIISRSQTERPKETCPSVQPANAGHGVESQPTTACSVGKGKDSGGTEGPLPKGLPW